MHSGHGSSSDVSMVSATNPELLTSTPPPPPPSNYNDNNNNWRHSGPYNRGVSFDTFDNRDATDFALTLKYKHKNHQCTRRSRTFLCAIDQNEYSDFALEWLIDELVDDGDEIICLRVVEKDSKIASESSVEEGRYRMEAEKLMDSAVAKNHPDEKAISLIMELAVGKVQDIIQRMIQIYEPAVLIVGTRGRSLSGMQGLLPGSVSKYCLQQSPIPVIVVRPSLKREKKKKKRLADPSRKSYNHILRMSEARGSKLFDRSKSENSSASTLHEDEAEAVAKAVGLPSSSSARAADIPSQRLSRDLSDKADSDNNEEGYSVARTSGSSLTTSNPLSPTSDTSSVAVKSPSLQALDSPAVSDDEGQESEHDDNNKGHNQQRSDSHQDDRPADSCRLPTASEDRPVPSLVVDQESAIGPSTSGEEIPREQKNSAKDT